MGFDVKAALARALEAENQNSRDGDAANPANPAKRPHQGGQSLASLASLAGSQTLYSEIPNTSNPKKAHSCEGGISPHGTSPGGRPVTHTGKVVSLDAWRQLSVWEKHGPSGQCWDGRTQDWEELK
ncbi:hypothetical protein [uncultured Roseovarius sp.]|uniref:hypothetical protein n=1 Tax=uncultured Roseovarius sp. TaxID=293344 RepID=UPI00260C9C51|nr:hypothetical protein [uncultured Roseovarius sp.]